MILNFLSNFKFYLDCTKELFYKIKINSHGVYVVKTKTWLEGFPESKKRRYTTGTPHVNCSESNDMSTYNSDSGIVNSNIPCININIKTLSNELATLQKETDTDSSNSINE